MKNKKKIFIYLFALSVTFVSCTDENKFTNPVTFGLENGAFATFKSSLPDAAYPDPSEIAFADVITDPNNTISSYSVKLIANLSGNIAVVENFFQATSFPATFSFDSQSLATSLGVDVTDISFGDTFNFIATAVRNDGTIFLGTAPSFDLKTLEISGGNTEPTLQVASYKSAMQFNFIVACPFDQAAMIGTWRVDNAAGFHATSGGSSGAGETFEVIAGPNADELILKNPFGSKYNYDIVIKSSPFGIASFEYQFAVGVDEICCPGYTSCQIRSNPDATSLALSCIGYMELKFNTRLGKAGGSPSGLSFGDGFIKATKI